MVPAKGGPKILKRKCSWRRRSRLKILDVSLKHWKGTRGGGGGYPPLLLRGMAVLIHPWGAGDPPALRNGLPLHTILLSFFYFWSRPKVSWRSLPTLRYSRQRLGSKAQGCPMLR